MLTSAEIAQMMAAQNQMFLAQRSYAQQVGVPSASPFGGGGMQQAGGAFSYAGGGTFGPGVAGGNAFAGGAMSAGRAAMTAGGLGLGVASMFGRMGAMAPLLDPLSGGMAGFARAGLMGGMAGAALPLALGAGVSHVANAFIGGGQQQQMITNQLGQFNHMNPASRSGQGFSRDDAQAIGSSVRSLAHIPEMLTSVEELTKMMPKLKAMGVMQGVKDASEFASRFRESIKTIRDVSKMLGTTMEEASEFFAHSRNVGFLGRQAQLQNTMNVQFTSGVSGMTTGQVMQLQKTGADMALSSGARRSTGARATTNIAQQLALAQRGGYIKEGELEDITGLEGPEAIAAASQRFAGVLANVAQSSSAGRLSMFGMLKTGKDGRVQIDDEFAQRYQRGGVSQAELRKRAGSLTHAQKISAKARMQDLALDFAGKTGPQGFASFMESVAGDRFGSEGVNALLQEHGRASAGEADVMQSMMGSGGGGELFRSSQLRQAQEAAIREKTDPGAIMKRLKTRLRNVTTAPIEAAGAKVFSEIGKAYDEFVDDLVGRHITSLSKEGADKLAGAMAGGSRQGLKDMFAAAYGGGKPVRNNDYQPGAMAAMGGALALGAGFTGLGAIPGALIGGAMAGGDYLWQKRGSFRDTELGASLFNGRSDVGQAEHAEELGLSIKGAGALLNGEQKRFRGQGAAALALRDVTSGIEGYDDMSSTNKLDAARDAVASRITSGMRGAFGDRFERTADDKTGRLRDEYRDVDAAMTGDKDAIARLTQKGGVLERMESGSNDDSMRAASLIRSGIATKGSGFKGDFLSASISGAQGKYRGLMNQVNFMDQGSDDSAERFLSIQGRTEALRDADKGLDESGIKDTTKNLLKTNGDARKAVKAFIEEGGGGKVAEALNQSDSTTASKMLQDLGIDVKATDVEAVRNAAKDAHSHRDDGVTSALSRYENAKKGEDLEVILRGFKGAADDLDASIKSAPKGTDTSSASALSKSLRGVAAARTGKAFGAAYDSVEKNLGDITKAIGGTKDAKKRAALIQSSGVFGQIAGDVTSRGERLVGKSMGPEELSKALGLGEMSKEVEEGLAKIGIQSGQKTTLTKGLLEKAETAIVGARGAGQIAGKEKTESALDVQKEMIETLKKMQVSSGAQVEILGVVAAKLTGEDAKGIVAHAVVTARENAGSSKSGATKN